MHSSQKLLSHASRFVFALHIKKHEKQSRAYIKLWIVWAFFTKVPRTFGHKSAIKANCQKFQCCAVILRRLFSRIQTLLAESFGTFKRAPNHACQNIFLRSVVTFIWFQNWLITRDFFFSHNTIKNVSKICDRKGDDFLFSFKISCFT